MVLHQQPACPSDDTEAREQSGNFQLSCALFFYLVHSKNAHVVSSAIGSYLLVLACDQQQQAMAFRICEASGASLANHSQEGRSVLEQQFSSSNLTAPESVLFHPCRVLLGFFFLFQLTQPREGCKVGGSTIAPGCLSSGFPNQQNLSRA